MKLAIFDVDGTLVDSSAMIAASLTSAFLAEGLPVPDRTRMMSIVGLSLVEAMARNVTARHRNVGLVIETRPDWITQEEIVHLRRLGVTKVQIGVQSLDDEILSLNKRGHDVAAVRQALGLLPLSGHLSIA